MTVWRTGWAILLAELRFIRPMYQQAAIVSRHQMSKQMQAGIQLASVFDGLMYGPQPLGTKILGRHGNHDMVGGQQRVPTALIQIRWAVNQRDIVVIDAFQELGQGELQQATRLWRGPIVSGERLVGADDGEPGPRSWLR